MASTSFNLVVGSKLQFEAVAGGQEILHSVTLVGYLEGQTVVVSWPEIDGRPMALNVGDTVTIQFDAGDSEYTFDTNVVQTCSYPFPYLHLSYPQGIQPVHARRASRFPVNDLAMMLVMEENGRKMSVALADISLAGARLVAGTRLGERGERFSIEIPHKGLTGKDRVVLPCEVRYVRQEESSNGGKYVYHHGVEFTGLTRRALVFIEQYIGDKVIERRGAQV